MRHVEDVPLTARRMVRPRRTAAMAALATALFVLPAPAAQAAGAPAGRIVFPSDALTVPDPEQLTGRRVALPMPDCEVLPSRCHEVALLNELDGFDLDPRITIDLAALPSGDVDAVFDRDTFFLEAVSGGERIGVTRFVLDPTTRRLSGHPERQLADATTYRVVYEGAGGGDETTFTTMSATRGLAQMRASLDDGSAYGAAGIPPAERGLQFVREDGTRTVFRSPDVLRVTRYDQRTSSCEDLTAETVLDTEIVGSGLYAFGSFRSPSWLDADRTIPQTPTRTGRPVVTGEERVGVTLIVPAGSPPEGGWPVAIFGPGITRSKYDLWLAADANAAQGLATMSFDPAGHAFGPCSEVGVQLVSEGGREVRFLGFGRGIDQDGDGEITNQEGVSAPDQPHPKAAVALRDGLRQTAADVMALVRAIRRGVDVDGDGTVDLRRDGVTLYAQSLGGIYGTMVMGADPLVEVAVLNVPGGPIVDIARLSPGFRGEVRAALEDRQPCLLNGGHDAFDESLPLFLDPAVTDPAAGAIAIQEAFARTNWIDRPGSPETFAPLLDLRPLPGVPAKRVVYQYAFGDRTVPNPTSATIARAGDLFDVTSFYRNDRTVTAGSNPHGFLLDPRIQGRNQAQQQVVEFLTSGGGTVIDPDGPAPTWEVPIADPASLETLNFSEDLYAEEEPAPEGCGLVAAEAEPPGDAGDAGDAGDGARRGGAVDGAPLPTTGGGGLAAVVGALALLGAGAVAGRRRRG